MIYSSASLLLFSLTVMLTSSSPPGLLGGDPVDGASRDDSGTSSSLLPLLISFENLLAVEEVDMVGEAFIRDVVVAFH